MLHPLICHNLEGTHGQRLEVLQMVAHLESRAVLQAVLLVLESLAGLLVGLRSQGVLQILQVVGILEILALDLQLQELGL